MLNTKQLKLVVLGLRDLKKQKLWHKDLDIFDLLKAGLKVDAEQQVAKAKARWKAITDKEQLSTKAVA
mgnify:CR=1 FL=1